jgi:hypothetical protein
MTAKGKTPRGAAWSGCGVLTTRSLCVCGCGSCGRSLPQTRVYGTLPRIYGPAGNEAKVIGAEFEHSDAGKSAFIAKRYLEGAATLNAATQQTGRRILHLPTLALAGHGLEVMLKACMCLNGNTPPTKGRLGHDIGKLWAHDSCEPVRVHVLINARLQADNDRVSNIYPDVPARAEVDKLIYEYVEALGRLHGEDGYALRYPSPPETMGPRAPLLVGALWRTSDDLVKRPNDFVLDQFRKHVLPYR